MAALVALGVLVAGGTAPARGQSDPRSKQEKVEGQQDAVAGQIDVLQASAADVQAGLAGLQSQVAAAEAALAQAQAAVDAANAALGAAIEQQAVAQRQVDERRQRLRDLAIDSYVHADTRTVELAIALEEPRGDVDDQALRQALATIRADEDNLALERLQRAEAQLRTATAAAQAAADEAATRQAVAQSEADGVRTARDQQAAFAANVERRLDDKLGEAAALRTLDRQLSDQIAAEERALAAQVTPIAATPKAKPPPPPGSEGYVAPPPPAHPDLVTTHGITVARSIADRVGAMIDAADADGVKLTGSGYRSYSSQVALRQQNCGPTPYDIYQRPASECSPPTARPGQSNHERGLAIDFASAGRAIVSHDDPGWVWLSGHASAYGFYNLDSEPWHWSVDGY